MVTKNDAPRVNQENNGEEKQRFMHWKEEKQILRRSI